MTLMSTSPFEQLLGLQRELERAVGASMLGYEGTRSVFPPMNIFHAQDGVVVRAEIPGFTSDQIDISAEPRTLVVRGSRAAEEHGKAGSFHRRERQHGSFARSIALPANLDTAEATAECKNGLLTIRIPKAEAAKPKRIAVHNAA